MLIYIILETEEICTKIFNYKKGHVVLTLNHAWYSS